MNAQAKNLERICQKVDWHNRHCRYGGRVVAVRMNPLEIDRLGWDEIRGLPIIPDSRRQEGTFWLDCSAHHEPQEGVDHASAPLATESAPEPARAAASPDKARTGPVGSATFEEACARMWIPGSRIEDFR